MRSVSFFVPGHPATAGSKKAFAIKKAGRYTGRTIVTDSSGEKGKLWRQTVQQFASEAWKREPTAKAVQVNLAFYFQRPKSHYGSGKNERTLKDTAPNYHLQKPDVLKLARAVEDALTGIVYVDDSQIVVEIILKHWSKTNSFGCLVNIHEFYK